ncbi:MAG TPA: antitoxin Xre/MbcA/ParS toxin-binding domain-containing protein [Phnomibacter sp.]|nr:antitoxin Xre/MbcA/ParS toxin-binding domain-containing protein [Phnomibacter sp.]
MKKGITRNDINSWLEKPTKRIPSKSHSVPLATDDISLVNEAPMAYADEEVRSVKSFGTSYGTDVTEPGAESFEVSVEPMLAPQARVPEYFMDNFEKSLLAKQGITKVTFEHFKERAGLDYNQLAHILGVARNTLINKKGLETFDITISEKLIGIAEVYTHGFDAFGNGSAFHQWLQRPNKGLGGIIPFSLLDTQYGRQEIHTILGRIEWGVFS